LRALVAESFGQRRCRAVLLRGEPGIGKSRLLDAAAALARAAGAVVLEAAAYEAESIRPFALFVDALRKLEPSAAAAVFEPSDASSSNRGRLFERLGALVAERTAVQPVVLKFDDLQWSDESSAAALHYVVRTSASLPLLVLLASRRDELRDNTPVMRALKELHRAGSLEELDLEALDEDAMREIIDARAPEADAARLCKECGGNPLLAIELARAEAAGETGQSLREVLQERLARFEADGGDVLRWAAVLAPRIDAASLARLTGLDWNTSGEALETAARHSMLFPADRGLRFSHDLIARSIYEGIPPARRRTMHRRVAELLEQDSVLEPERAADLAHHAAQSGDPALAARAMISAGRLCLRFFANDEALALAGRGLQWVEQLPSAIDRVCLTLELREIMHTAAPVADWETAAREYAALAEQALDHGALAHARRGYFMASYVHWMHGHFAGAREEILQSERIARSGGGEEHIVGIAEPIEVFDLGVEPFRLTRYIFADSAKWDPLQETWVFRNGWIRNLDGSQATRFEQFETQEFSDILETPDYFRKENRSHQQMNWRELQVYIADLTQSGFATAGLNVLWYRKFSFPFFAFSMALLAVPFAMLTGHRGALAPVAFSLVLAISFYALSELFEKLGQANQMSPLLAAWAPGLIFCLSGVYLFLRVRS
jgi:hypothetical protein